MRYSNPAVPGVYYKIGSRVVTYNGLCGTLLRRFKPGSKSSSQIVIHDEHTDTDVTCPEHYIIKVLEL